MSVEEDASYRSSHKYGGQPTAVCSLLQAACGVMLSAKGNTMLDLSKTTSALKKRQQATWSAGDYAVVGSTLQIVGERLCEAVGVERTALTPRCR